MNTTARSALAGRIDVIESSYEFMLAYAAQGRTGAEQDAATGIRKFLSDLYEALDGLAADADASLVAAELADSGKDFLQVLRDDAGKSQAIIRLVLARSRVSSQVIDNLNASIHLRALLTDIFVLDEVLSPKHKP